MAAVVTPVLPSEFQSTVIAESDSICTALIKLIKFAVLWWRYYSWMHVSGDSTELSDAYKAMLCNAFTECSNTAEIVETEE